MILFTRRIWGFRLIDVMAFGLLIALILSVYLAKTIAGRERGEIARVEDEIVAEQERIRLLQAEVSHLERPDRVGRLPLKPCPPSWRFRSRPPREASFEPGPQRHSRPELALDPGSCLEARAFI